MVWAVLKEHCGPHLLHVVGGASELRTARVNSPSKLVEIVELYDCTVLSFKLHILEGHTHSTFVCTLHLVFKPDLSD